MLNITFKGSLSDLARSPNIAKEMTEDDLRAIGLYCHENFLNDKGSRARWEEAYAQAMELALQVIKEKNFPWPKCANIKFPLVTVAAINFHARAYPAIINGEQVVNYKVFGEDPDGMKEARAQRITDHQNYLLLEKTDWEEHTDKGLLVLPIMGCIFKKTFFNTTKKCPTSTLVLPQDLVVPYYTANLEHCPRISEMFALSRNAFTTRVRRGQFLDIEYSPTYSTGLSTDALQAAKQDAQKLTPVSSADDWMPSEMVEQHCYLDLDDDGYAEPYVVTFVRQTGQVCRIVARYSSADIEKNTKGEVVHIEPTHYYTKIPFIPSPDGGFYDLGFGMLLGPLNHAVDSMINQTIDAATMEILGGGFVGRGVKIKRGETTFAPYEWKTADTPGVSLKDNIVPLPVRGPSQVLLELITFLIGYSERISGANEVQMGELPKSQAKAGPMEIANNNGMKIFAAIYKRIWRAEKQEFTKIYQVTALNPVPGDGGYSTATGSWFKLQPDDYKLPSEGIFPYADPNVSSQEMDIKKAMTVLQLAREGGSGQDVYKATMRLYKAMKVARPEEIYPDPKGPKAIPPQPNPALMDAETKRMQAEAKAFQVQKGNLLAVAKLMLEAETAQVEITKMYAEIKKLEAEAAGVAVGHNIALIQSKIAAKKQHMDAVLGIIDLLERSIADGKAGDSDAGGSGVSKLEKSAANPTVLPLLEGSSGGNEGEMGEA